MNRHWVAYHERWNGSQDAPKVITPRDDADVAEWRRLGYRVEGPFVLESDDVAVKLLRELRKWADEDDDALDDDARAEKDSVLALVDDYLKGEK